MHIYQPETSGAKKMESKMKIKIFIILSVLTIASICLPGYAESNSPNKTVKHTYLFEEGNWVFNGTFQDATGGTGAIFGAIVIVHTDDLWILETEGTIKVGDIEESSLEKSEVRPFQLGAVTTNWTTQHKTWGLLNGNYTIMDDTMIANFENEDGSVVGFDLLQKLDDHRYRVTGIALTDNKVTVTWNFIMERNNKTYTYPFSAVNSVKKKSKDFR